MRVSARVYDVKGDAIFSKIDFLIACVASVSVLFPSKDRAKNGVSFLARPKPRISFLGLSLLRNSTETLATQANFLVQHMGTRGAHAYGVHPWFLNRTDGSRKLRHGSLVTYSKNQRGGQSSEDLAVTS